VFSFTFFLIATLFFNNTYKYIIIISKIPCLSINARHHLQVRSKGCSGLQIGCQLHYHTADSVLNSGCSCISQHIWNKICIVLAILGRCIKSEKFTTGKRGRWIRISDWQIDDFGMLSSSIVTSWRSRRSRQRWRRVWSRLSASVGWRCPSSFPFSFCLRILCSDILRRKASGCLVSTKYSRVSFYRSHHLFMSRKLNTLLLLFSDLGGRFLDQQLRFLNRGAEKPSFRHLRHI